MCVYVCTFIIHNICISVSLYLYYTPHTHTYTHKDIYRMNLGRHVFRKWLLAMVEIQLSDWIKSTYIGMDDIATNCW